MLKNALFDTWSRFPRMTDVPMLLVSGWYDSYADATTANFTRLRAIQKSEKRLIMGPWSHGYGRSECGDEKFGPAAELDENALQLDWFEHWMRGAPYRVVHSAPVQYFRMGLEGGWHKSRVWPPPSIPVRLYVSSSNMLARQPAPEPGLSYEYLHDSANPVPTHGGRQGNVCIVDQKLQRDDVLTFTSAPFDQDIDVTGRLRASLVVSTAAPSADVILKAIDVRPDGYAAPIAEGQMRIQRSPERREVAVDLGSVSIRLGKGHRVRLDIMGSSYPKLEPNPNPSRNRSWAGGRSYVELPVTSR